MVHSTRRVHILASRQEHAEYVVEFGKSSGWAELRCQHAARYESLACNNNMAQLAGQNHKINSVRAVGTSHNLSSDLFGYASNVWSAGMAKADLL